MQKKKRVSSHKVPQNDTRRTNCPQIKVWDMKSSSCNFLSTAVKIRIITTIRRQTFNWCKLAELQSISADAKNKVSSHSTSSTSEGCLCPHWNELLLGFGSHINNKPLTVLAHCLCRNRVRCYPKTGDWRRQHRHVATGRAVDSTAATATLVRGHI